jgi:hypothetical protein
MNTTNSRHVDTDQLEPVLEEMDSVFSSILLPALGVVSLSALFFWVVFSVIQFIVVG